MCNRVCHNTLQFVKDDYVPRKPKVRKDAKPLVPNELIPFSYSLGGIIKHNLRVRHGRS